MFEKIGEFIKKNILKEKNTLLPQDYDKEAVVSRKAKTAQTYESDFTHDKAKNVPEIQEIERAEKSRRVSPGIIIFIIPANKVGDIHEGQKIDTDTCIQLVDVSVYFGCFPEDKGNEMEKEFDLKEDKILWDTAQDIYVRLNAENGTDFIEKSSKFGLKKCLKNNPRDFKISKIRLLDKLHGLEKLNRI